MIPWIQVYSNLLTHPKTGKLVDELSLKHKEIEPESIAAGLLVAFWTWAIQNAVTGDLKGMSNRSIAKAAGWLGNADKFVEAMKTAGWIERNGYIHDWEEYAILLMESEEERKQKNRERVQRHRNKKSALQPPPETAPCNADVTLQGDYCNGTEMRCNAPTLHNITEHNNIDNNSIYLARESESGKALIVENSVENPNSPPETMSAEEHERLADILEHAGLKLGAQMHREDAAEIRRAMR